MVNVENNDSKMQKAFSLYVVLLPIIQYYKSPLTFFNLATFLAFFWLFIFLYYSDWKININRNLTPIYVYIIWYVLNMCFTSVAYKYSVEELNVMNFLRGILLLGSLLIMGYRFWDINLAMIYMEKLLVASSLYMVLQHLARAIFNFTLLGALPALISNEGYVDGSTRGTGFFMEPAAFAQAAILFLCYKLYVSQFKTKKEVAHTIIIVGGIALSGSGQGYALLILLLALYFAYHFFFSKMAVSKIIQGIIILLGLVVIAIILSKTAYGQYVLSHIYLTDSGKTMFGGQGLAGRTYTNKHFYKLSNFEQLWGLGIGKSKTVTTGYINSLFFYLLEGGYVSIAIWILMMIIVFVKGEVHVRMYCILYAVQFCFNGCGKIMMLCFSFLFMLFGNDIKPKENGEE